MRVIINPRQPSILPSVFHARYATSLLHQAFAVINFGIERLLPSVDNQSRDAFYSTIASGPQEALVCSKFRTGRCSCEILAARGSQSCSARKPRMTGSFL